MSYSEMIEKLDSQQRAAVQTMQNTVVAAGAGSGKTRVLAARYASLIIEKGYKVDQILTLTFTKKATSEMYNRIYTVLSESSEKAAQEAVANFHLCKIQTIDSYSAALARLASRRYGVSPDFIVDEDSLRQNALNQAIPFVLKHRANPAIQALLGDYRIEDIAKAFAALITKKSTLTQPIDFDNLLAKQWQAAVELWTKYTEGCTKLIGSASVCIEQSSDKTKSMYKNMDEALKLPRPPIPHGRELDKKHNPHIDTTLIAYLNWVYYFTKIKHTATSDEFLAQLKGHLTDLRGIYPALAATANWFLQYDTLSLIYPLLKEFQDMCSRQKRLLSMLSYGDIAQMAVDALIAFPDIRQNEKQGLKAIMIDEFQDNNQLQRDLLFLLAEKPERMEKSVPTASELCPDRLFFVGDEKQSIYRFRGADVSVFRKLKQELKPQNTSQDKSEESSIELATNYRSRPSLIWAFNTIFGGFNPPHNEADISQRQTESCSVFLPDQDLPLYEATYSQVLSPKEQKAGNPALLSEPYIHLCILDKDENDKTLDDALENPEIEAFFVAKKINELVESKYTIREKTASGYTERACSYKDFAILFKTTTHQHLYENHLGLRGVPYASDNISGFFKEAPVNDMYNLLRLCVYQKDTNAYGSVLVSPFVALSRESMILCLLDTTQKIASGENWTLFDKTLEEQLPEDEKQVFARGRCLFEELQNLSQQKTVAELVSWLWYSQGYRYELLHKSEFQGFAHLYDYFFELARRSDNTGQSLVDFVDQIQELMASDNQKIDDMDIPIERVDGVRLMTVHRSKGLEFPIVFVCNCGGGKPQNDAKELLYFDQKLGVSLNIKSNADIPDCPKNIFYQIQQDEDNAMAAAELRRLLYVALTRAESSLYITGSHKELKNDSTKSYATTFFELLLPAVDFADNKADTILAREAIPIINRQQLNEELAASPHSARHSTTLSSAKEVFDKLPVLYTPSIPSNQLNPSQLGQKTPSPLHEQVASPVPATDNRWAKLDKLFFDKGEHFTAAQFGTIAHIFVEAAIKNQQALIPANLAINLNEEQTALVCEAGKSMAQEFLQSPTGQLLQKASWLKSEFSFKSRFVNAKTEKEAYLSGQIDLTFICDDTLYLIDFKTDRLADSQNHIAQMAAYRHAIEHIQKKSAQCRLYYLRSGQTDDVTQEATDFDLAAAVFEGLNN